MIVPVVIEIKHHTNMSFPGLRTAASAICALLVVSAPIISSPAHAEDQPPPEQGNAPPNPADAAKLEKKARADQAVEAGKALKGPAANPECVWLGERVVGLLWRDDLDTAFRHLELYDRFGCPGNHVQATFRCVVVQGNIDPKATETLNSRVHACWLNPESFAAAAAAPPTPAAPATQ
ncbi:MAG: beta-1-3, beta-1-6-glucan biosynthesis protein [Xanthobacteraceae bacterium]